MTRTLEPPPPIEVDETRAFVDELHQRFHQGRGFGPELSAGDPDARWDLAESSGEETAGGSMTTPDQNVVGEIGAAIGVSYGDEEPLKIGLKEASRDRHRWELDPASADDYREREMELSDSGPSDQILSMTHGHLRPHKERGAAAGMERRTAPALDIRGLRRIALLAHRAASDWGGAHPELWEVTAEIERALVKEQRQIDIGSLIRRLGKAGARRSDGRMYDVVRRDLIAELTELSAQKVEN